MRHKTTHSRIMNIQKRIVFAVELVFTSYLDRPPRVEVLREAGLRARPGCTPI